MPLFREVLKNTIASKSQRLMKHMQTIISPKLQTISRRREEILNFLRNNQRIQGFVQPRSFSMSDYQSRSQTYFNRLIGGISRFIRRVNLTVQSQAFSTIMTPSAKKYRDALNRVIEKSRAAMVDLARDVIDRRITVAEFRKSLGKQIRQIHMAASFIGIRSITNITPNIIEIIRARISKQLNFLNDFTSDIQEIFDKQGDLTTKQAQKIVNSAGKYASAAKATASDAERQLMKDAYGDAEDDDEVLAMRVLGGNENHCLVCPSLAGEWMSLDDITAIGNTPCTVSCYCSIIYARASDVAGETLPPDTLSVIN